jgi:Zn finger protein HypA/HybF involved in hydrogenase expression
MGKLLAAECPCGYQSSVVVGSGRELHGEIFEFPHYCSECNEAVSVDLLKPRLVCPLCNAISLTLYGTRKNKTIHKKSWFQTFGGKAEPVEPYMPIVASDYCLNLDTTFEIAGTDHTCPKCKNQTLRL